jgi:RNA polymerase sigma-70 factor (ECF subfamily)
VKDRSREELFHRIIEGHKGLLYFIIRNHASGENMRDLYQEIQLRIWQSLAVFKGDASSATWVYRVALNTAIDFLDRQKRNPSILFNQVPESVLQNMQAAPQTDGVQLLQAFMESLAGADREIFGMYLNDFSYREISEITGLGENCLRMRISRIKKRFEERHIGS